MKLIILLLFFINSIVAQNVSYNPKYKVSTLIPLDFAIDNTSQKSIEDINNILHYLNDIYYKEDIGFYISNINTGYNILLSDNNLLGTLKNINKINNFDNILIIVVGEHSEDIIGQAWFNKYKTNRAIAVVDLDYPRTNRDCAGLLGHEIGHVIGLKHNNNKNSLMHILADEYSNIFTREDILTLNILTNGNK